MALPVGSHYPHPSTLDQRNWWTRTGLAGLTHIHSDFPRDSKYLKCDRVTCVWVWIHNDVATPLQTLGFSQSIAAQFNFKWPASDGIATLLRWRTRLTGIYLLTLPHVTANLDEFWFHSSFQDSWPFHLEPSYGDALAYLTGSTIASYCQSWISERMPWWVLWTYRC